MRYVTPLFFFAAAAFVWHHNTDSSGSYLLVPFVNLIPGLENDVPAQGQMSWKILAGLGGLLLAWTVIGDLRRPRHRALPDEASEGDGDD